MKNSVPQFPGGIPCSVPFLFLLHRPLADRLCICLNSHSIFDLIDDQYPQSETGKILSFFEMTKKIVSLHARPESNR